MSASQIKDFLKDIQLHNIFLQLNILDSLFQLIIKVAIALRKKNGLWAKYATQILIDFPYLNKLMTAAMSRTIRTWSKY